VGGGNLELTAGNTYSGPTTLSFATLRLSNSASLPGGTVATSTGSNLTLDGGVVELAAGDFTRSLGTGPGQVQFTANGGGFSAVGANRAVNLGGNSPTLTWGSGSFLPDQAWLMLGTAAADSRIDFQNPINLLDLGNGPQTVQVTGGSGAVAVNARLSGVLSGSGGLAIAGGGNLELTASNTYTGSTTVSAYSILRLSNSAALPSGSNLTLDSGVVELAAGDFTRSLGAGSGQVQFTANGGGFAAVGANRAVNLSNSATLTWDDGGFLPNGTTLMLGSRSADSTIDFQNAMILGSGSQAVEVTAGSGTATVDARLSGILSGSGALMIIGDGVLVLSGTDNSYSGGTVVESGTLIDASNGALPDGSSLTVGAGATLMFGLSAAAASPVVALEHARPTGAVPEPGTLALLVAALAVGFGVAVRKRMVTWRKPL
jgi:autotransporter-associated beta strand protein